MKNIASESNQFSDNRMECEEAYFKAKNAQLLGWDSETFKHT